MSPAIQLWQKIPRSDFSDNLEPGWEMVELLDDSRKIENDLPPLLNDFEGLYDLKALVNYPNKHLQDLLQHIGKDLFHAYISLKGLEAKEAKWKAIGALKSKPDSTPHGQLESQETPEPLPSIEEVYVPYDCQSIKFSVKDSFGCIQVIDGMEVRRVAQKKESMLLLKDPIVPFTIYTFDWRDIAENSVIGMGLCKIGQVKEAGYSIPEVSNHGCYMLFSNNECLINGQADRKSTEHRFEKFKDKKRIAFYYDSDDRRLKFITETKGPNPSIDLSNEDDLSDFYPCISTSNNNELHIYLRDEFSSGTPVQFIVSREHKASEFFMGKSSSVACFSDSAIGVLEWRVMHNRP